MTRRTKILATLGPATDSLEKIQALIAAGANTVRMNFSHGQAEDHIERAKRVRQAAKNLGKYVAILGDLQGPKIRVARFAEGAVRLEVGAKFILDAELGRDEGDINQEVLITKRFLMMYQQAIFCFLMTVVFSFE